MAFYRIEWKQSARAELRKLEKATIARIIERVATLTDDPRPVGSKKLRSSEHSYRIRIGNYRVVYSVHSDLLLIEVVAVGHRKDVYQRLR